MADILKVTTPLVNKNHIQPNKQVTDPTVPFNLQDISKVVKPSPQSELLKQNNGMKAREEAPALLMNLLKDPAVTVSFLKNIFMLQEIIRLLPVNNQTITQELDKLFESLLVSPENIVGEMINQENTSTVFKGELFDLLRGLIDKNPSQDVKLGVANLLKAINSMTNKGDILGAVANSLMYLSEGLGSSKKLSQRLSDLAEQFRKGDAEAKFNQLKAEALGLFEDIEESILFSPKMAKVMSMSIYNMSRFNSNSDFFGEAVSSLLTLIDGKEQKEDFLMAVRGFLAQYNEGQRMESSKVMDVLAKIIGKESYDESITLLNSDKIEKIIHSLLSSPCNFTPLLHFIIPVKHENIKSFAEIWINPNGEEDERGSDTYEKSIHMLLVFDIEGIGQFETELFVRENDISLTLLCPPAYKSYFEGITDSLRKGISFSRYRFDKILVEKLERPRSLMEVFKSLPYKRTGVDVKI